MSKQAKGPEDANEHVTPSIDNTEKHKIVIWCADKYWEEIFDYYTEIYSGEINSDFDVEFQLECFSDSDEMYRQFVAHALDVETLPDTLITPKYHKYIDEYADIFLLSLDEYVDKSEFLSDGIIGNCSKDGKLYGYPIDSGVVAFYYNRDVFDDNGIEIPDNYTIEDFISYATAIKEATGKYIIAYTNDLARIFMQSTGELFYNGSSINCNNVMELLELFEALRNAGVVLYGLNDSAEYLDAIRSGEVYGVIGAPYWCDYIKNIVADYGLEQNWDVSTLPKTSPFEYNVSLFENACMIIAKNSEVKHQIIAGLLTRMFNSEDGAALMMAERGIVPITKLALSQLSYLYDNNYDYGCFNKNVLIYLMSLLPSVPTIEYFYNSTIGVTTDEAADKLDECVQDIFIANADIITVYNKFYNFLEEPPESLPDFDYIKIGRQPDITHYYKYENFSPDGMIVYGFLSDGSRAELKKYTCQPVFLNKAGEQIIQITYESDNKVLTTKQVVSVKDRKITDITVNPLYSFYLQNDTLSNDDFIVWANYNEGPRRQISDFTIVDKSLSTVGSKTVTVNYTEDGVTCSYTTEINVYKKLLSISIASRPNKLMYYKGDRFNAAGAKVSAYYSDGSSETLPVGGLTVTPQIVDFKSGQTSADITISYSAFEVVKTATLKVYKKTGVEIEDCDTPQDFGECGSGAVNLSSGNLTYGFTDFACNDSYFPIVIARTYKSDAGNCGVGDGWRLNLQQELYYTEAHWNYIDKTGKKYVFDNGFSTDNERSAIRNEKLGFDLFISGDKINLVDRGNNTLVFTKINTVYKLSEIHQYPSTPNEPIDAYSVNIEYLSDLINKVAFGRKMDDKRRTVEFNYANGSLAKLIYDFSGKTTVAEYTYNGSALTAVKKSNGNVSSQYSRVTKFEKTDDSFTVSDMSSKDSVGNYRSLIYKFGSDGRVKEFSVGYGATDRETSSIGYTGRIEETSNPETDVVESCYMEYNGTLSVVSFNSLCAASSYSYEKGEDGSYNKPKKVNSASSRGFDYSSFANTYSDTLDVLHDDFSDGTTCGWSGGQISHNKYICGSASLSGNSLSKSYTVSTSAQNGVTLYLSLWAIAQGSVSVKVKVAGKRGEGDFTHKLDSGLNGYWQFTAFNLGRILNGEKITIEVNGSSVCLDDIRLTKAPYETPDNLAEPVYNAFGNIEKEYVYNPVDSKVACSTYTYNDEHQMTQKVVTVDDAAHSKTIVEYENGLPVSNKQYGTGQYYTEEKYSYSEYVQIGVNDVNNVQTMFYTGIDWAISDFYGGIFSPSRSIKNIYYDNSDFVKTVSSSSYDNDLTYNSYGQLSSSQYGDTQSPAKISFTYDTFGNINSAVIGDVALVSLDYNYKHLNKIYYANGGSVSYTYDGKDRVTAISESGGYTANITYSDTVENIVTVTDSNGLVYQSKTVNKDGKTGEFCARYTNDSTRMFKIVRLAAYTPGNVSRAAIYIDNSETPFECIQATTDRNGQLTILKRDYHGASNAYFYDELYRLKIKNTAYKSKSYMYEYTYENIKGKRTASRLSEEKFSVGDAVTDKRNYSYAENGNLTRVSTDNNATLVHYEYDVYGRLIKEYNYELGERYEYSYDVRGNIVKKYTAKMNAVSMHKTDTYEYNAVVEDSGQNSAWKDQLKRYNGNAITYDNSGNPLSYLGKNLSWNGRKLVKIDSTNLSYDYNGMRVKKGNNTYYWQDSKLRIEKLNSSRFIYYYYDESGVCGMYYDGKEYYYKKNMLGDILGLYDDSGNLLCRYVYDAFGNHKLFDKDGNTVADDGTMVGSINPFRYRGYYWDREFGLYYLNSRYYDPALGRFISPDDISYLDPESICGMNLYAYCGNNPIMCIDSFGRIPITNEIIIHQTTVMQWGFDSFWWGRVNYTITHIDTQQPSETGVFYKASIIEDLSEVALQGGINLWGKAGISGTLNKVSTKYNVDITVNILMVHFGISIGANGITKHLGFDINNTSHDYSYGIGVAPVLVAVGVVFLVLSGGTAFDIVADWFSKIFTFGRT